MPYNIYDDEENQTKQPAGVETDLPLPEDQQQQDNQPVQQPAQPNQQAQNPDDNINSLDDVINTAGRDFHIPIGIRKGLVKRESGGNPDAVSPTGARGIMQLTEGTAKEMGVDRTNPVENIYGGMKYLRKNYDYWKTQKGVKDDTDAWAMAVRGYLNGTESADQNKGDGTGSGGDTNAYEKNIMSTWLNHLNSGQPDKDWEEEKQQPSTTSETPQTAVEAQQPIKLDLPTQAPKTDTRIDSFTQKTLPADKYTQLISQRYQSGQPVVTNNSPTELKSAYAGYLSLTKSQDSPVRQAHFAEFMPIESMYLKDRGGQLNKNDINQALISQAISYATRKNVSLADQGNIQSTLTKEQIDAITDPNTPLDGVIDPNTGQRLTAEDVEQVLGGHISPLLDQRRNNESQYLQLSGENLAEALKDKEFQFAANAHNVTQSGQEFQNWLNTTARKVEVNISDVTDAKADISRSLFRRAAKQALPQVSDAAIDYVANKVEKEHGGVLSAVGSNPANGNVTLEQLRQSGSLSDSGDNKTVDYNLHMNTVRDLLEAQQDINEGRNPGEVKYSQDSGETLANYYDDQYSKNDSNVVSRSLGRAKINAVQAVDTIDQLGYTLGLKLYRGVTTGSPDLSRDDRLQLDDYERRANRDFDRAKLSIPSEDYGQGEQSDEQKYQTAASALGDNTSQKQRVVNNSKASLGVGLRKTISGSIQATTNLPVFMLYGVAPPLAMAWRVGEHGREDVNEVGQSIAQDVRDYLLFGATGQATHGLTQAAVASFTNPIARQVVGRVIGGVAEGGVFAGVHAATTAAEGKPVEADDIWQAIGTGVLMHQFSPRGELNDAKIAARKTTTFEGNPYYTVVNGKREYFALANFETEVPTEDGNTETQKGKMYVTLEGDHPYIQKHMGNMEYVTPDVADRVRALSKLSPTVPTNIKQEVLSSAAKYLEARGEVEGWWAKEAKNADVATEHDETIPTATDIEGRGVLSEGEAIRRATYETHGVNYDAEERIKGQVEDLLKQRNEELKAVEGHSNAERLTNLIYTNYDERISNLARQLRDATVQKNQNSNSEISETTGNIIEKSNPKIAHMTDDEITARVQELSQKPKKGTSAAKRADMEVELNQLRDEAARRFTRISFTQPENKPIPEGQITFKDFVENEQPQGGVKFNSLTPEDSLYKKLKTAYDEKYPSEEIVTPRDVKTSTENFSVGTKVKETNKINTEQDNIYSDIGTKLDSGSEFHYKEFTKPNEQAVVGRLLSEGRAEILPDGTIRSTKPEINTEAAKNIRQTALDANKEVFAGYSKDPDAANTFTKEELTGGDIQHIVDNGAFSVMSGYDNAKRVDRTPEMKRELESKGYTVLDADGMYKGKREASLFVIHKSEDDPTELNAISAKYNQQQAMHGVGGYYTAPYTGGENAGKTENFGRTAVNNIPANTEAYTSVKFPGGGRHNFTVTDLYDNERAVTPKYSFDHKGSRYTASHPDDVKRLQEVDEKIRNAKDDLRKITKAAAGSSQEQDASKKLHQLLGTKLEIKTEIAKKASKENDSTVQRQQGGEGLQGGKLEGQGVEQMPVQQGGGTEASRTSGNVQVNGQPQLHVKVINSTEAPRPVARETDNSYILDNGNVVSKNKAEVTYKPVDTIGKKQSGSVLTQAATRPSRIKADDGSTIDLTDRRWSNDNKYVHMETRGKHGYVNERAMQFLMVGARDGEMPTHRTFGVTLSTPEAYQMVDRIRDGVGMLSNPKLRNEAQDLATWLEYHTDQQLENDPDAKGITALMVTPFTRQEQIDVTGNHEQIHVDTFKQQGSRQTLFDNDTSRQLEKSEGFGVLRIALKEGDSPYKNAPTDELASEVLAFGLTNDHDTLRVSKNVMDEALLDVIEHLDKVHGEKAVFDVSRAAMRDVQELLNVVQNRARNKATVSERPRFGEDLLTNVEGTSSDRYGESEYSSGGEQTRWAKTYEDHLREITPEQLSERRKQLGFWKDNPGGEWLAYNTDIVTAGYDNADIDVTKLRYLPGAAYEHESMDNPDSPHYNYFKPIIERYANDMRNGNWDWEKSGGIHIIVDTDGKAVIYEGNRRMRAAIAAGLDTVPVNIRYKGGSEDTARFDPARQQLAHEADLAANGILLHANNSDEDVLTIKRLTKSGNPFEVTNVNGRERQMREMDKAPVVWNFFIKDKSDNQYHLENDFKGGNWKEYETTIRPRLYDFHTDALNLRNESSANWMSQLISAGYHGFWNSNPDASPTFRNRLAMFDTPESREMLMTGKKIGLLSQSNEDVMTPDELENEFKDSKVRDENGNLLKTYHATPNNFQNFDLVGSDIGIHFGTKEQAAERIKEKGFENSRTIPAYLNIKNPLRVEDVGAFDSSESVFEAIKDTKVLNASEKSKIRKLIEDAYDADGEEAWKVINKNINGELRKILLSKGYDGLVYRNDFEGNNGKDSYVAFEPEQIKSAISPSRRLGYLQATNAYSHFIGGDVNEDVMTPDELENEFKDSKVRDENGNLLKLYHGTLSDFDKVNPDLVGIGIHLTPHPEIADEALRNAAHSTLGGANIKPVYANITNPVQLDEDPYESMWENPYLLLDSLIDQDILNNNESKEAKINFEKMFADAYLNVTDSTSAQERGNIHNKLGEKQLNYLKTLLINKGYDGVFYANKWEGGLSNKGTISIISLNPEQIKSAISPSRRLGYLQASPDEAMVNGKHISDWTPEDWKDFGDAHGVDNLGLLSPLQTIKTVNIERERNLFNPEGEVNIQVPGGLDGKFSYYDLLHLKANPIPVNELDEETHAALMKKLTRTLQPPTEDPDNVHLFNQYVFGMTSPGTGLSTNQFAWSQLRASTPEDITQLASYSDNIKDKIANGENAKDARLAVKRQMESDYNLGKRENGGLGVVGNYDVTSIAELAAKFRDGKGDWYRKRPDESWSDLAERVSSEARGLGTKVAMFTTVWQAPHEADTAAIDLHMMRRWRKEILGDKYDEAQETAVDKWNKEFPQDKVTSTEDILNKPIGTVWFTDNVMVSYLGAKQTALTLKDGNKNPKISEGLQKTDWPDEVPQKVQMISEAYRRGLDKANEEAARLGLSAFEAQWMFWDKQRERLEPHEIMFPGLHKLPKPSIEQMRAAREAHSNAGFFSTKGFRDIEQTVTSSPSHLGYFQLDNSSKDEMESVHPEFIDRNRRTVGEQLARDVFFNPDDIQEGNEKTTPETAAATTLTKGFESALSSTKKALTPEEEQGIVEAYKTNGVNKLQKMFGRTDRTIRRVLTDKGVQLRERPSNLPEVNQPFDEETKANIIRLYTERQMSYRDIATKLDLEASSVGRVITNAGIARNNSEANALSASKRNTNEFWTGKRVKYTANNGETYGSDSTYELAFMNHIDGNRNVESWNRDVPIIPYNEGNNHYVPDFIINFKGGKKALIEIKPFSKLNDADVIAKANAGREWAAQNGMSYHIITERELGEHSFSSIDLDKLNISDEEKGKLQKTLQHAMRNARVAQEQPRDFNSLGLFHAVPKKTFDEQKLQAADENEWLDLAVAHSKNGVLSASEAKNISDLATNKDIEGLQNFVAGLNHQSVLAMIANARRAGIISGGKTLAKIGTAATLFQSLEESSRLMASSVDLLLSKASGNERTVQGVSPRGIYNGVTNAITKDIPRSLKILKYGDPAFNLEDTRLSREATTGYIWAKPIEAFSNYVMRSHGALSNMIKTYAYHRAAYEVAALKAKANGTDVRLELANLTPQESDQAWRAGEVASFMNPNPVNTAYQRWRGNRSDVTKFLLDMRLPIVKVPTNVVARALDYTGLSQLYNAVESDTVSDVAKGVRNKSYTQVRDALVKAIDTPDVRRQISFGLSKAMLGWTLGVVGWHLAKAGLMYGFARPEDKNRRNVQELENSGDGNIKLGDRWYNISNYSPVATMLLAGASFYEDSKAQSRQEENGHEAKTNAFTSVLLSILKETPYVSVPQDFLTNDNKQTSTLASIGNLLGINTDLPASFVPALVGNVATTIDPKKRDVAAKDISSEIWNKVEAKIPGLREKLPEHKNIFGESESQPVGFDPFASRKANTTPLTEEMKAIGFGFGIKQKEGESLEDLRDRRSTEGIGIRERLEKLIKSPYYGGSEKERREAMSAVEKFSLREEKANKFSPDEEQHNLDVIAWREANKKSLVDILAGGGFKDIKPEDRERYVSNVVDKVFVTKSQKIGQAERQFENLRENPEQFIHKVYTHRKNRSKDGDTNDSTDDNKANVLSTLKEGVEEQ